MIARTILGKLLVFSVFFVGIATGVLLDTAYRTRTSSAASGPRDAGEKLSPQDRAKRDQDRMAEYLGLESQQREQIQKVLAETREQFRQLRATTDPQFKAIEDQSREKIRVILNPEQQKKMDEFWARRGTRGRPNRSWDKSATPSGAPSKP